jgi:hypothetical protein
MDQEAIKKALDFFEEDKFSDAKEIMQKEIRTARDEFLTDKLGIDLQQDQQNEDSTADAKGTLDAIIGSTKKAGGDIYDMAMGMKKSFGKNKGFSKDQANWIYKTSKMMF